MPPQNIELTPHLNFLSLNSRSYNGSREVFFKEGLCGAEILRSRQEVVVLRRWLISVRIEFLACLEREGRQISGRLESGNRTADADTRRIRRFWTLIAVLWPQSRWSYWFAARLRIAIVTIANLEVRYALSRLFLTFIKILYLASSSFLC